MKSTLKTWLAPMGVCGLITFAALASNRMVTAQAQPPEEAIATVGELQEEPEVDPIEIPVGAEDGDDDQPMGENLFETEEDPNGDEQPEEDDVMDADQHPEQNSEADELEARTNEIVEQIEGAKENREFDRVQELKAELLNVTRTHFKLLESKRREQVAALEKKLAMLKEVLDHRAQNADQIIDRRIKSLLQESDTLDWNPKIDNRETWRSEPKSRGDQEARERFSRDWLNRDKAKELLERSKGDQLPVLSDRYRELESLQKMTQEKLEHLDRQWRIQWDANSNQRVNPELKKLLEDERRNLEEAVKRMDAERAKYDEQLRKYRDALPRELLDPRRY